MSGRAFLLSLLIASASCTFVRAADDAALRAGLHDFLTSNWQTGTEAKAKADVRFAALAKGSVDARAYYARALVYLYQRRYDETLVSLDRALSIEGSNLAAWRAKIWLAVLIKKYDIALNSMESLAKVVAADDDDANKEATDDAARFLGSVYGFLDGPLAEVPAVAARGTTEKNMLEAFSEEQRETFTAARQAVIEKHISLTTERADSREKAIAEDEAEKEKILADIEQRRAEMATQADDLKDRRTKLQSELRDQLDEISKKDRPLLTELSRLNSRGAGLNRERNNLLLDINRLEADLSREEDPVLRDRIRRDIDRLSIIVGRYDVDLDTLSRLAGSVQSQRAALAAEAATAQRNLGGDIQSIDRQFAGFAAEERRLAGTEKRARKPSTGSTGKVYGLGTTATALKTYEPFPIEQERQRLLTSLK